MASKTHAGLSAGKAGEEVGDDAGGGVEVAFFLGLFADAFDFNQCEADGADCGEEGKLGEREGAEIAKENHGGYGHEVDQREGKQREVVAHEFVDGAAQSPGCALLTTDARFAQSDGEVDDDGKENSGIFYTEQNENRDETCEIHDVLQV